MPVLHRAPDLCKSAAAVVFDWHALGAGFANGHGVAWIIVVQGLFRTAVIGDFATGARVAVDVARRVYPTVVDLVFFDGLRLDFKTETGCFWHAIVAAA